MRNPWLKSEKILLFPIDFFTLFMYHIYRWTEFGRYQCAHVKNIPFINDGKGF